MRCSVFCLCPPTWSGFREHGIRTYVDSTETGAHIRTRTGDLFLTKEVLYLLSYVGLSANRYGTVKVERETGLEPATLSLEG